MTTVIRLTYLRDLENETSTHISATHAISKIEQKSQNRIPRELDQKFGIPRIVTIYWVSSTFFGNKKSLTEKSYDDFESRNSTYGLHLILPRKLALEYANLQLSRLSTLVNLYSGKLPGTEGNKLIFSISTYNFPVISKQGLAYGPSE